MKSIITSTLIIILMLATIIGVSLYISGALGKTEESIAKYASLESSFEDISRDFSRLRTEFLDEQPMLRLLISDDALLEVECLFGDVIAYADTENREGVATSVERLRISIAHLRGLSGLNLKSIF